MNEKYIKNRNKNGTVTGSNNTLLVADCMVKQKYIKDNRP